MAKATYAPGTEYIVTLNNGNQLATGGFDNVQAFFNTVKALWDGSEEGSITTWDVNKKITWSSITTYETLFNPYTIVAVLDVRNTDLVVRLV